MKRIFALLLAVVMVSSLFVIPAAWGDEPEAGTDFSRV